MTLKTFRGNSMTEALSLVKKDLGGDAVILHTRTFRVGGIAGFGGKSIIEITASSDAPAATVRAGAATRKPPPAVVRTRPTAPIAKPMPAARDAALSRAETRAEAPQFVPASWGGMESQQPEITTKRVDPAAVEPIAAPPRPKGAPLAFRTPMAPVDELAHRSLEDELASIKRLVGQVLQCTRHAAARSQPSQSAAAILSGGTLPEHLFAGYVTLTEAQVDSEIVDELIGGIRNELEPSELADADIVRATIERKLAERIRVVGHISPAAKAPDGRPLTIALTGPTGVGKTTTIAKLAATYKLRHGKKIGLVTTDTYRIAAVDQLRVYANIIGLPLKVVMNPAELRSACDGLADCDAILIDTAGRSQHDAGRLDELKAFITAASPHETHLVLSAAVAEAVLLRAAQRFSILAPDRLLFTKLDEAVNLGALVNIAARTRLPVSHVTTGQEVPDQIELADASRLARRILCGEIGT